MANNRELSQFANVVGYNGGNIGIGTDDPNGLLSLTAASGRLVTLRNSTTGFASGDGLYFYPGSHGPLSSIRWEALRDGIEDAELLLAAAAEGVEILPIVRRIVQTPAHRDLDPESLEKARREVWKKLLMLRNR